MDKVEELQMMIQMGAFMESIAMMAKANDGELSIVASPNGAVTVTVGPICLRRAPDGKVSIVECP